jgi:hypothetical protein
MDNFNLADLAIVGCAVVGYFIVGLREKVDRQSRALAAQADRMSSLEKKLSEILQKLSSIESGIDMITPDSARVDMLVRQGFDRADALELVFKSRDRPDPARVQFESLPAFLAASLKEISSGTEISLVMLNDLWGPASAIPIKYIHRELAFRTSYERDPIAYGQACIVTSGEMKQVRILFNCPHATATMRGLEVEGHVKKAPP